MLELGHCHSLPCDKLKLLFIGDKGSPPIQSGWEYLLHSIKGRPFLGWHSTEPGHTACEQGVSWMSASIVRTKTPLGRFLMALPTVRLQVTACAPFLLSGSLCPAQTGPTLLSYFLPVHLCSLCFLCWAWLCPLHLHPNRVQQFNLLPWTIR